MTNSRPTSTGYFLRQFAVYTCAILLPVAASIITARTPSLSGLPFALSFTVIAGIGVLAGPGPAVVSILVAIPLYNFHGPASGYGFSVVQLERTLVLVGGTFFLTLLSWKQRSTEKKLRSALVTLQERTDSLLQAQRASELATWLFNSDTMETFWDPGSTRVFGRPFVDLDNKALPMEFIHPEDREALRESTETAIRSSQHIATEFRVLWPNGEVHWLESRGTRLTGTSPYWRGATFDVTRRKAVEAALVRSEKLAAMGRLASTVAHEVNNPLESVTNLLYLIGTEDGLSANARSYLALAEEELARLSNITRLTLTFARSNTHPASVNVAEVLDAVLSIYQRRYELLGVEVERFYTPGLEVEMPPHEMRQIAINLVANALDALTTQHRLLRLHTLREDGRVIILIEDSGTGIDLSDQTHVFDAFYTTKAEVGTGIGLWVTRELTEKNEGKITVESGEFGDDIRTRFRLDFPAASSAHREAEKKFTSDASLH